MPVTTVNQEKARLRSYLNPYIKGPKVDAVLEALATGSSSHLINNAAAVNNMLYITTASGQYLDERLAEIGLIRPSAIGLSDEIFREIGIEVKNRKQVRDLIDQLLGTIFGDEYVKASNSCQSVEPFALADGDTLIVNFNEANTATVTFNASDFQNIATATAQEVADSISKSLSNLGLTDTAIAKNDGNGAYVEIISNASSSVSSVTVLGGRAQNVLKFDSQVSAGAHSNTQWTLTVRPGGIVRFTWTGGSDPLLGNVSPDNYVNIYGGGFASSANQGSYTVTLSVGGSVGNSYFEIVNPLGVAGVITQGTDNAVLFYNPVRKTIASRLAYAAVYQTQSRILQIFMPAATRIIRRNRIGSTHVHYAPQGTYTLNENPNPGDTFSITSLIDLIANTDFAIGATAAATAVNLTAAINAITGLVAISGNNVVSVFDDSLSITLDISYTGAKNIVGSGPLGDMVSLQPNQQGSYGYDLTQPFTVSEIGTLLNQASLDGSVSRLVEVADSTLFPDSQGYIVLGYGTATQEGPIPYVSRPSSTTLLISPTYTIQNTHLLGEDVALVSQKAPVTIANDGTDYPFYVTDVVSGRLYAQDLINSVAATGISIVFTILYPGSTGLGKWNTIYSEIADIYGP